MMYMTFGDGGYYQAVMQSIVKLQPFITAVVIAFMAAVMTTITTRRVMTDITYYFE
jgi:uncharacterized membrane protein YedE/YeeE